MKRQALLVGLLALLGAVACADINNHLLQGQEYDPGDRCLGGPTVIDDLPGSDPGDNCTPECLLVPAEGGPVVFITTTCPPYAGYPPPELQDAAHDAGDPCVAAFAAYYSDAGACTGVDGATPETGTDAAQDAPDGAPPPDATVESGAMPEAGEAGVVDAGPDAPGEAATGD